jgi:hypothetical protein
MKKENRWRKKRWRKKRCLVIRSVAWGPPYAATDADEELGVSDIFVGVRPEEKRPPCPLTEKKQLGSKIVDEFRSVVEGRDKRSSN